TKVLLLVTASPGWPKTVRVEETKLDCTPARSVGACSTLVMSALLPLERESMFQVITPLVKLTPAWLLETKETPDGTAWLKTTLVAALGPLLTTVATQVKLLPDKTVPGGMATAETPKSADGPTVTVTEAELLKEFGSVSNGLSVTTALAVTLPVRVGLTVTVTIALELGSRAPSWTAEPPGPIVPWVVAAEMKFTFGGRVMFKRTCWAR